VHQVRADLCLALTNQINDECNPVQHMHVEPPAAAQQLHAVPKANVSVFPHAKCSMPSRMPSAACQTLNPKP
jgi:hypothetical protein